MLGHVLPVDEVLHQLVAGKQVLDLAQVAVEVVVVLEVVGFGHGEASRGRRGAGAARRLRILRPLLRRGDREMRDFWWLFRHGQARAPNIIRLATK